MGSTSKESVPGRYSRATRQSLVQAALPSTISENTEGELLELLNQAIEEAKRFAHRRGITDDPPHGLCAIVSQLLGQRCSTGTAGLEHRYLGNLVVVQVGPDDPPRSAPAPSARPDDLIRRHDEVDAKVVLSLEKLLVHDLEKMNRRGDCGRLVDEPFFGEQGELEIGETAALSDAAPVPVHGNASAYHQVDAAHA